MISEAICRAYMELKTIDVEGNPLPLLNATATRAEALSEAECRAYIPPVEGGHVWTCPYWRYFSRTHSEPTSKKRTASFRICVSKYERTHPDRPCHAGGGLAAAGSADRSDTSFWSSHVVAF